MNVCMKEVYVEMFDMRRKPHTFANLYVTYLTRHQVARVSVRMSTCPATQPGVRLDTPSSRQGQ